MICDVARPGAFDPFVSSKEVAEINEKRKDKVQAMIDGSNNVDSRHETSFLMWSLRM